MEQRGWKPFRFQRACWEAVQNGNHGLLHAPTGSGKTFALFLSVFTQSTQTRNTGSVYVNGVASTKPHNQASTVRVLWITPLKALAADLAQSMTEAIHGMGVDWKVELRTGDTSATVKKRQRQALPEVLVTTPESIHVLLSYPNSDCLFRNIELIVVDEWHELLGSKRGVQTELALARLRALSPSALVWGISATIGNLDQARQVLLGRDASLSTIVTSPSKKSKLIFQTMMPSSIERYPWTGHVGLHMLAQAEKVVNANNTTLVFTNTRSQAEIWYQHFLSAYPEYAGIMAMHHGSLDRDVREWVEAQLKRGALKVVFCTSSLDLGVDYPAVDAIIQIGSPKGVARFLQRAGRSGHGPTARSKAWFLPTHALEIIEGAAIRTAIRDGIMESRQPYIAPIDVLVQWLVTLACADGFSAQETLREVRTTHAYAHMSIEDWNWCIAFITTGGASLTAYDEFLKVVCIDGRYHIANARFAARHRMQIGTISSDMAMTVALQNGRSLGTIEESFISRLSEGDTFVFAGRMLELIGTHEMTAFVKPSKRSKGAVARWSGGRLPLSEQMSEILRITVDHAANNRFMIPELRRLRPMLELQASMSALPRTQELLIERYHSPEGYHAFFYPFEGRLVHEGLAVLLAYRLSQQRPITFTAAMNDYGFELVADQPWRLTDGDTTSLKESLFSPNNLAEDILNSANMAELERRRFRDIVRIAGLLFQGFPGQQKKTRHLQSSAGLFYDVFRNYDSGNLLLRQARDETLAFQLDEDRMYRALMRIQAQTLTIRDIAAPTPFCAPILVDRLRETLGSERTEERIKRLIAEGTTK